MHVAGTSYTFGAYLPLSSEFRLLNAIGGVKHVNLSHTTKDNTKTYEYISGSEVQHKMQKMRRSDSILVVHFQGVEWSPVRIWRAG